MSLIEVPGVPQQVDTAGERRPAGPIPADPSEYTQCASYREAKNLAGSRRRERAGTFAVFIIALNCWCVRIP